MSGTATCPSPEALSQGTPYKADNPNQPRLALKNLRHFVVSDESGWIPQINRSGYGLYCDDTRYLSCWEININGNQPVLLAASIDDGHAGSFAYSNPTLPDIQEQSILLKRSVVLNDGLHERIAVTNFDHKTVTIELTVRFGSDFADMFEVRGSVRPARGAMQEPQIKPRASRVRLGYRGLDGKVMETNISFTGARPSQLTGSHATFSLALARHETMCIDAHVTTALSRNGSRFRRPAASIELWSQAQDAYARWRAAGTRITTGNVQFNRLLERKYRDLFMLRQPVPRGIMLAAGIPWFVCGFGRDQTTTGLQTAWLLPGMSADLSDALGAYQGTTWDNYTVERPGKILHELRLGEMARLREIPFAPYFGSVDATQLWLMLVCEVVAWTGNLAFARRQWPRITRALAYFDRELSGTGYLRYGGDPGAALVNQGWKDSFDAVVHKDGSLAQGPIALCEAQGYLHEAWLGAARLAELLGHDRVAARVKAKAADLRQRFQRDFWMPDEQFVALALDGQGRQCQVVSSNPGHLLASGLLSDEQARAAARRMMQPDMFTGWGIRTLASSERSYNPMSYHCGSVWPHDNGMAAASFGKLGLAPYAHRIMSGLFDAARLQPDLRLPELFCGFERPQDPYTPPVRYPVSCAPQAWAAGSVFQMLLACLGLKPDAPGNKLEIVVPSIPDWLGYVKLEGLRVGSGTVDLLFQHTDGKTSCSVLQNAAGVQVSARTC